MTTNAIKFNELSLETLTELAKESFDECSNVFQVIVENENRLANFGRILAACREKVPAGQWTEWLQQTFAGCLPLRTAQRWIVEAVDPEKAEANRERDRKAKARKAKAKSDAPPATPGVEVVDPGLKPEPKTNTKHTAENRKANPEEQPATRPVAVQAELVSAVDDEPSGNAGQLEIAPELLQAVDKTRDGRHLIDVLGEEDPATLLESCFRHNPVTAIVRFLINSTADKDVEDVAKQLRKAADTLDPPKKPTTKFVAPSVDDVAQYCRERKNSIDAEVFVAHYAANGWKLSNGNKMADWKSAVITWEKRNDSGKQAGRVTSGRIKPGAIDESKIEYR